MTTLQEVLQDFSDESKALENLLTTLDENTWLKATPAEGWDVRDTVAHLADTDDVAYDSAMGGPRDLWEEAREAGPDGFTHMQVLKGREKSPAEVIDWWRASNLRLRDMLAAKDPGERLKWGPNMMSPVSFTTARLMETWAHGLDVFAAAEVEPVDTDRLRHVAFIGVRALPYHFTRKNLPDPGPLRVELTSPSGEEWTFGPEGAPTVIRGTASDWCRVAVQRDRAGERAKLDAWGPGAEAILENVQAYL